MLGFTRISQFNEPQRFSRSTNPTLSTGKIRTDLVGKHFNGRPRSSGQACSQPRSQPRQPAGRLIAGRPGSQPTYWAASFDACVQRTLLIVWRIT